MGISYNPKTVTDGLVLALDAANIKSYNSGISTTTWFDRSGNGNNGTLTNGVIYSGEGSYNGGVQFDGTGDFLSITYDSSLKITENNDWTIEFWMYASGPQSANNSGIYAQDASYTGLLITADTGRNIEFTSSTTGSTWDYLFQPIGKYTDNTWNHVAVTKSGTTLRTFFNGSLGYTTTTFPSSSFTRTDNPEIGRYSTNYFNGFISNFRLVKGTALYTANFTPPTAPLTAVTNTVLLTCQGNTIADASSNAHTITANGDVVAVGNIFPGPPIDEVLYFSFDGSNDYVEFNPSSSFDFSTGDFAVESWFYLTGNAAQNPGGNRDACIFNCGSISLHNTIVFSVIILGDSTTTGTGIQFYKNTGGTVDITRTVSISQNAWHHLVVSRIGTSLNFYLDNSQLSSPTTDSNSWGNSTTSARIGYLSNQISYFDAFPGKISNVRLYKGKGLTASEIRQNFNALRGRFGI